MGSRAIVVYRLTRSRGPSFHERTDVTNREWRGGYAIPPAPVEVFADDARFTSALSKKGRLPILLPRTAR